MRAPWKRCGVILSKRPCGACQRQFVYVRLRDRRGRVGGVYVCRYCDAGSERSQPPVMGDLDVLPE